MLDAELLVDFCQLLEQILGTQVAGYDNAIRVEENVAWDAVYAIGIMRSALPAISGRIRPQSRHSRASLSRYPVKDEISIAFPGSDEPDDGALHKEILKKYH